jgi:ADP-heptose:LPS heptosyltransferase
MTLFLKKNKLINRSASMIQKYLHIKPKVKSHTDVLIELGYDRQDVETFFAMNNTIILPYIHHLFSWEDGNQKVIALAPGASERWESKKWGNKNYLELTGELLIAGYKVVLIGSSLEKPVGEQIEAVYPAVVNLIAKTSLSQLKGLLSSVDLLICNDSGPAHLAAGVGTDTVTVFGSTDIKHCVIFGEYRGRHSYLVSEPRLECQPCYKSKCPTQHECMENISVHAIFEMIRMSLNGNK